MVQGTGDIGPDRVCLDSEFSSLCWKLTESEKSFLIESIKAEGCHDPIRYWDTPGHPIVDGYNRHEICLALGMMYQTIPMQFADRAAAIEWIIKNQLGRRNASDVQKTYLIGKLYGERKQEAERERDANPTTPRHNIAQEVAEETGVPQRKVHRDASFAQAMDRLAIKSPTLRNAAMQGEITKKDATALADAPVEIVKAIAEVPESERNACVKTTLQALSEAPPLKDSSGRPVVDIKALADLERTAGELVRAKTAALKACGGKECVWAWKHHEDMRGLLGQIFDVILAWQKEAQSRKAAA